MDVYIKLREKVQVIGNKNVMLRDVAEVLCGGQSKGELEQLVVFGVPEGRDKTYLLSVIDVIGVIDRKYPNASISNLGGSDVLLEYHPKKKKERKFFSLLKGIFVGVILFTGSATTIMAFHSDAQMPLVFQNLYYIFFGENKDMPAILAVPYSIGLVLGITVFFNHFSEISLTDDPTPIEVEMTTYEKETNASLIDYLNRKKEKKP